MPGLLYTTGKVAMGEAEFCGGWSRSTRSLRQDLRQVLNLSRV